LSRVLERLIERQKCSEGAAPQMAHSRAWWQHAQHACKGGQLAQVACRGGNPRKPRVGVKLSQVVTTKSDKSDTHAHARGVGVVKSG
jgi:hypothetical protein